MIGKNHSFFSKEKFKHIYQRILRLQVTKYHMTIISNTLTEQNIAEKPVHKQATLPAKKRKSLFQHKQVESKRLRTATT